MIPAEYKVRDLVIRPATVLAPMAGVTDTLFRRVIRELGGCGLLMTEFTSSEGITRSAKKTLRYLCFEEDEHPIAAQLFGANPGVMADAARRLGRKIHRGAGRGENGGADWHRSGRDSSAHAHSGLCGQGGLEPDRGC